MVVSGGGDNFSACGFLEGALAAPQSELARSQVLLEVIGARAAVGVRLTLESPPCKFHAPRKRRPPTSIEI
jgi:hypothetical protein